MTCMTTTSIDMGISLINNKEGATPLHKKDTDMKEIIKDYMSEDFTVKEWVRYGIVYPILGIAACLLAGMLE